MVAITEDDFARSLDSLEALYRRAMAAPKPSPAAVRASTLSFLRGALPRTRSDGRWPWMAEREALTRRINQLEQELAVARADALRLQAMAGLEG